MRNLLLGAVALATSSLAVGGVTSVDLGNYQLSATYSLPAAAASEASAVTYNWDTNSLFVLGDEGDAVVEVDFQGQQLSVMTLTGFDDTEALSYTGNGRFTIAEERLQNAYDLTYSAGGSAARGSLPTTDLGPTVGNVGIEGLSYDPRTGTHVVVKEKTPQRVLSGALNFGGTTTLSDLFTPSLGVLDLSDVQVLATVPSLIGTADEDNLLIFSQESQSLLEVTRAGAILSSFSLAGVDNAEGVTIDNNGVIYIVGENPSLYVLTPIPEPTTAMLLLVAAGLAAARRR